MSSFSYILYCNIGQLQKTETYNFYKRMSCILYNNPGFNEHSDPFFAELKNSEGKLHFFLRLTLIFVYIPDSYHFFFVSHNLSSTRTHTLILQGKLKKKQQQQQPCISGTLFRVIYSKYKGYNDVVC